MLRILAVNSNWSSLVPLIGLSLVFLSLFFIRKFRKAVFKLLRVLVRCNGNNQNRKGIGESDDKNQQLRKINSTNEVRFGNRQNMGKAGGLNIYSDFNRGFGGRAVEDHLMKDPRNG